MEKEKNKNKVKLSEKISLTFRKKLLINGTKTFLIIAILITAYIALNLWIQDLDLPEIDVTENKIYTLSDASKQAIEKVEQPIKIYAYGFEEGSSFIGFLKQYHNVNEKIEYEIITEENNAQFIQQYNLEPGYSVVILTSGESKKIIDASQEFSQYDYTTYQSIDTTEEVMTNSILALTEENKPKVYFVEGHNEFTTSEMTVLSTFLKNEAFESSTLNILTENAIPDDCDILAIMSPTTDFFEPEVQIVKNYINKGGKIYFAMDTIFENKSLPNLQQILDEYGVTIPNGYIIEQEQGAVASKDYPYLIIPTVSQTNKITSDIYTAKTKIILMFASKLQYKDDATLSSLNVSKETLLSSSDKSLFISNVTTSNLNEALQNAEVGSSDISALLTKTIKTTDESGAEKTVDSQMIVVTCGRFIADTKVTELGSSYPLSSYGSNKDFVINSLSYLGNKGNILTVRKDFSSSTYTPTAQQNIIVLCIIFIIPIAIILMGVIIWTYRKKRK